VVFIGEFNNSVNGMEDKVKIIYATPQQFNIIWNKLLPSQRIQSGMPTPNMVIQHLDTTIVLRESVEIGSIESFPLDMVSLQWLDDTILHKKYFEVG